MGTAKIRNADSGRIKLIREKAEDLHHTFLNILYKLIVLFLTFR